MFTSSWLAQPGKIDMEYMRSCAVEAGYGPRIQLQSADRRRRAGVYGAVRYLTKYITKSLTGFRLSGASSDSFFVRVDADRQARQSEVRVDADACLERDSGPVAVRACDSRGLAVVQPT